MTDLQTGRAAKPQGPGFVGSAVCWAGTALGWAVFTAWLVLRCAICAILVLGEPVIRAVLVPLAFLGFLVTMIFGFLIGDPRFPRWGMLAFSVGALVLYWCYLGFMSLFMSLPSHDRER
ncbi:hypothetical protein [Xenophilus sp. Marseille-Q4582]|uniref:hypothetical protein n=1 Tax=Xenophilus sp. Marseille-Q4582 TaxID=2866600 RepID=UPI001CE43FDA|nr:hypothetical protein [Xenophilus sp. Marseille-Q4582]